MVKRVTCNDLDRGSNPRTSPIEKKLHGPFDAGLYQVFSGDGSVSLPSNTIAYPEWWGVDGTDDEECGR